MYMYVFVILAYGRFNDLSIEWEWENQPIRTKYTPLQWR